MLKSQNTFKKATLSKRFSGAIVSVLNPSFSIEIESTLLFLTFVDIGVCPTTFPSIRTVAPSGSVVKDKTWSCPLKTEAQPVSNKRVEAKLIATSDFKIDFICSPSV